MTIGPLLLMLAIAFVCPNYAVADGYRQASDDEVQRSILRFEEIYAVVEENYSDPIDPNKAIYDGAIPGMLRALDPHSTFLDRAAYAQMLENERGKRYVVGLSVGSVDQKVVVITAAMSMPAYRAGIRPGDIIVAVDGNSTKGLNTEQVREMLKSSEPSIVHLAILREGCSNLLEFAIQRKKVEAHSVDVAFLLAPHIGYIHIAEFTNTTDSEVRRALKRCGRLKGLILDLRQNPGGVLNAALAVADKFLPKGDVIAYLVAQSSVHEAYRVKHGDRDRTYPLVVVVDRWTASAAELVAGALQDHDRALILGEPTFGKALVQTVFPLSDGTALALTTAQAYLPSGRLIQRRYKGVPMYEYFYMQGEHETLAVAHCTDDGRPVYGGAGIAPDRIFVLPQASTFQIALLRHYAFINFAKEYLLDHVVGKNFEVTDDVIWEFQAYLNEQRFAYTPTEIAANQNWLKVNIKAELFSDRFGLREAGQIKAENDPEILEAESLLQEAPRSRGDKEELSATESGTSYRRLRRCTRVLR